MNKQQATETHSFKAEVKQLLHLMIHSLYSDREIFLRELISNASDACDKRHFAAMTSTEKTIEAAEPEIRITIDKDNRHITVTDNGIGMNKDEVIENLGTIARSGTQQFVDQMSESASEESDAANLIGQFGVGFYSSFMVADEVRVESRRADAGKDEAVQWISDGTGEYSLESIERDEPGTTVMLHIREGADEFLEATRIRHLISRYSDHISIPIKMKDEPLAVGGDDGEDGEDDSDNAAEKNEDEHWQVVNSASAIWTRSKNEISEEEYQQFYTSLTYDPEPPLATLHNRVEGNLDYTSLLFLPRKAPFDLWDQQRRHRVKLYVRRVFITDEAESLFPAYLRFVKGVVDAADLPLNVSREFLQNNRDLEKIRSASVKRVLTELERMAADNEQDYEEFWHEFGKAFKEGVVEDHDNREKIAGLLRYQSTKSDDDKDMISLNRYIERMPIKQKAIYYLTAETEDAAQHSPHLEIFRKKDIEVLLMTDPIDEWVVGSLPQFQDKPLQSVSRGALDLDEDDEKASDQTSDEKDKDDNENPEVLTQALEALNERVKEVRYTNRLTDSPACLVADENDPGANLERILKAAGQAAPSSRPILELNAEHPLVARLKHDSDDFEDWMQVLFDQAALSEGAQLDQPNAYVKRVNELLSRALPS